MKTILSFARLSAGKPSSKNNAREGDPAGGIANAHKFRMKLPSRTPKPTDWLGIEVTLELIAAGLLTVILYRWLM